MNMFDSRNKALPYVVTIALFFIVTAAYFAPQFGGKVLQMHDITQYEGMARDIKQLHDQTGEHTEWTGGMFGGMPSYMISINGDSQVVKKASNKLFNIVGSPSVMIFLAMSCFWLMLLLFGVNPWIGAIPALAYGLSTYSMIIIDAGHITKMWAFAYAPLFVGAVYYTLHSRRWLAGAALTALSASLLIGANHPQITYYFCLVAGALWINELYVAVKQGTVARMMRRTALLLVAGALAIGSNSVSLYYTLFQSSDTTRGGSELAVGGKQTSGLDLEYATAWSYGKLESVNMLIPNLMGGSSMSGFSQSGEVAQALTKYNARDLATQLPTYWGAQPMTAGPTYIGAVVIFLAIFGLFTLKGREKWWVLAISFFALLLSWGHNLMWFTELMFKVLPGYNKFRTVSMILVIVQWSVPMLAALIINKLWKGEYQKAEVISGLKWSSIIVVGTTALFYIMGGKLLSFSTPADAHMQLPDDIVAAMMHERGSMMAADALRSLILAAATAGVIYLFVAGRAKRWMLAVVLALLVCVDLIPVDLRFLPQSKFVTPVQATIQPTEADKLIMEDKDLGYRVANFAVSTFNDATTSYFHRSVGGYHGAKMSRYQDLIDRHLSKMNMEVYNMMNTRYIITPDQQNGTLAVQKNEDANGAAWFIETVSWANGAEQEIEALNSINTKKIAVVDETFRGALDGATFAPGEIAMTEYQPNRIVYEYSAPEGGVAIFSEIYYGKGWSAYVDGEPAEHFRADYVLRGMQLPAGDHVVEFRFKAPKMDEMSGVGYVSSWLIILACVAAGVLTIIREKKDGSKRE